MSYGILSFGGYVPTLRMNRQAIAQAIAWAVPSAKGLAKGERAFANWDEDSLTLAVEAARDCLQGFPREVAHLQLASTTLPFADRSNSGVEPMPCVCRARWPPRISAVAGAPPPARCCA